MEQLGIQISRKILKCVTEHFLLSVVLRPVALVSLLELVKNADSQHHTHPGLTDPQSVLKH